MCVYINKIVDNYILETTWKRGTVFMKCNYTIFIVNKAYTTY